MSIYADESKTSIVGQYGDMPIDMLLRKQEQTCMYESPHQVEDFHRATLKDLKPDAEFYE